MDNLKRRHTTTQNGMAACILAEEGYDPISLNDDQDDIYAEKERSFRNRYSHTSGYKKYMAAAKKYQHVLIPTTLTLLSFITRFYDLARSDSVVWDEAHFGKFGSYYLKREYYFDVHPPLGKMLVGLSGWLVGYDGSFDFQSGAAFPEGLNYWGMRLFNAAWGAFMVPLAYGTAKEFGMSMRASILAATMVLLDTAYLCISRFILLDSMLLFFTCTSLYCLAKLRNTRQQPFSKQWWLWMFMTGLSLGCVSSVKWVGLFAVAMVGVYTLEELWELFGDPQLSITVYAAHWVARAITLIAVPMAVYVACFKAHFTVLSKSGPGDNQMSSLFQAQLEGNKFGESPLEIAFGSEVTIKSQLLGGGLLHSHVQKYPEGSQHQQITIYHHKDDNNNWILHPVDAQGDVNQDEIQYIQDGDHVRLLHMRTKVYLHSHDMPGFVTSEHYEVGGHGTEEEPVIGNTWKFEVHDDIGAMSNENNRIHTLSTRFRLRHAELGCLLRSEKASLPQWGFKQGEMTCDPNAKNNDPGVLWNIEEHKNEKLPPAGKQAYRSKFWRDFIQLNVGMWRSNNALIPDPDKEDRLTSAPTEWPLVSIGMRICGWGEKNVRYLLIGNPAVWWASAASLAIFGLTVAIYNVRMRRHGSHVLQGKMDDFYFTGKTLLIGWFFHYLPFFIMGRVTYLHHYFPALYFSIFMVPLLIDHFVAQSSPRTQSLVFTTAFALVISAFIYFSPAAFGMTGPLDKYAGKMWFRNWRFADEE
ncbi:hypothetical protein LRAMOSA10291 [Lichtheimia ramosa]|uniref:Dolichyl-phosphate-mannose--protein mannosyltransferase n=1 Tax=Lichtheimia ramosa TaxID=688394 RepID=A0A077WMU0_9FUNG|nr:hypothetical protein LRAMOSA10291 [Lichtheimia ramosa]